MELPGRRKEGKPRRRYMDVINKDIKLVGVSEADADDKTRKPWNGPAERKRKRKNPGLFEFVVL